MRIKLDENVPARAAERLHLLGHDVDTVITEGLAGRPDPDVWQAAQAAERFLVTQDLDFSDIRQYPPSSHRGMWVLRPETQSIENTLLVLKGALALVSDEPTAQRLWIVEPGRVRIRE